LDIVGESAFASLFGAASAAELPLSGGKSTRSLAGHPALLKVLGSYGRGLSGIGVASGGGAPAFESLGGGG
jgi:hypothetical protein